MVWHCGRGLAVSALALLAAILVTAASAQGGADEEIGSRVQQAFDAIYGEVCDTGDGPASEGPDVFRTTFTHDLGETEGEPQDFALYRFHCFFGAYNQSHVFLSVDNYGRVAPVAFAAPVIEVVHESDAPEAAVESITTTGFSAENMLINSEVDPDTLEVRSMSRWRGLSDASSSGIWRFEVGQFVLAAFDVDASYDGAVNPQRIYGEGSPSYGEE